MTRIRIKPGDKRLGRQSHNGRILPEVDVTGKPYNIQNMTVRALGDGYICVVPNRMQVEVVMSNEFGDYLDDSDELKVEAVPLPPPLYGLHIASPPYDVYPPEDDVDDDND